MDHQPRLAMWRLPPLTVGSASWSLPLTEHTADDLTRVLALGATDEAKAAIADTMSMDPAFALWTACISAQAGGTDPRCVVDLADWLIRQSVRVLQWPTEANHFKRTKRDLRPRWRELTADAVAVASLAADLAGSDSTAAEAFLFGLLHNAADWLRTCGPKVSPVRRETGCLPGWLDGLLVERARGPRSEPVRLVLRAGTLWREADRRGTQVAGVDLSEVRAIRKRWRSVGSRSSTEPLWLAALTRKLKRLDDLEQQFSRVLEVEKLEALGELAYGASHEINNPLANISARAQAMLRDETDPERRRTLAVINTQAFRANEMIADMMLFARPPEPVVDRVNVVAIIDDVITELAEEAQQQGTQLARNGGPDDEVQLWADGTQIAFSLRAILVNALESLSAGGRIDVDVEDAVRRSGQVGSWVRISIRDTGPGIPPEIRRHLFDPFFSGREAGRGMGLGLSKCWRIISLHQGRIDVTSRSGEGAIFTILLPASQRADPSRSVGDQTVHEETR